MGSLKALSHFLLLKDLLLFLLPKDLLLFLLPKDLLLLLLPKDLLLLFLPKDLFLLLLHLLLFHLPFLPPLQASSMHRMSLVNSALDMRTLTPPRLRQRMPLVSPVAVTSMLMLTVFSKL